jgi:hypothetical protein
MGPIGLLLILALVACRGVLDGGGVIVPPPPPSVRVIMPITSVRDINAPSCGAVTFAVLPDGDLAMQPVSVCGRAVLAGVCSGVPGVWHTAADAWPVQYALGEFRFVFLDGGEPRFGRLRVVLNHEPTATNSLMILTDNQCEER